MGWDAPKHFGMDWRVLHMPEDQVPTASRVGGRSGASSLFAISLTSLSVDTLGTLKEDENGNSFVIVIVDNFSKLIGLQVYPARLRPPRNM